MSKLVSRTALSLLALACAHCADDSGASDDLSEGYQPASATDTPAERCREMVDAICEAHVACGIKQGFSKASERSADTRECQQHYLEDASCSAWTAQSVTRSFDSCVEDLATTSCYLDATEGTLRSAWVVPSSCSDYFDI
jgi:hypothetical protein